MGKISFGLALALQGAKTFADTQIGTFIYAASNKSHEVVKIDATSFKLIKKIDLPNATSPYVLGVDPAQSRVFMQRDSEDASKDKRTIDVISTETDMITRSVDIPLPSGYSGRITGLNFSPDGSRAFISLTEGDSVLMLSGDLTRQLGVIKTGRTPWGGTLSPDGAWLYVPHQEGNIAIINTASGVLQGIVNVKAGASKWTDGTLYQIVVSPDGKTVYVKVNGPSANGYNAELLVLQPNAGHSELTLVKRVVFPTTFYGDVQLTADGKKLYMPSWGGPGGQMFIVDMETYSVTTTKIASLLQASSFSITRDGMRIVAAQSPAAGNGTSVPSIMSLDPASDLVSAKADWVPTVSGPSSVYPQVSFKLVSTNPICR